jgi:hypothetical protein
MRAHARVRASVRVRGGTPLGAPGGAPEAVGGRVRKTPPAPRAGAETPRTSAIARTAVARITAAVVGLEGSMMVWGLKAQ